MRTSADYVEVLLHFAYNLYNNHEYQSFDLYLIFSLLQKGHIELKTLIQTNMDVRHIGIVKY